MVPSIEVCGKQKHSPFLKFQDAQEELKNQLDMLSENVSRGNLIIVQIN